MNLPPTAAAPPGRGGGLRLNRLPALALVLAVAWVAFFVELGRSSLWLSQEGRIGRIARHMATSGNWLLPEVESGRLAEGKPVLYHWLVALVGLARGFDEVTVRAPAALSAVLTVVVVWGWASGFVPGWGALVAALTLSTSVMFVSLARIAHVDMLLTLWVTLAYLCFYLGYRQPEGRRRWFLLMYAALGLGMMTKGPIAVALPAVGIATFLVVRRELGLLRQLEWLRGGAVFLAIAGPWYLAVSLATRGQFLVEFLGWQNLSRFLGVRVGAFTVRRGEPWWFYGPYLLLATTPWTALAFGGLAWQLGRYRRPDHPARTLAGCWFVAGLVLLSISRGKRPDYLLPLLPALALLTGAFWQWGQQVGRGRGSRLWGAVAGLQGLLLVVLAAFVVALAVAAPLSGWWRGHLEQTLFRRNPADFRAVAEAFRRALGAALLVSAGAGVTAWAWLSRRRPERAWVAVLLTVALGLAAQAVYRRTVVPVFERRFEQRYGSRVLAAELQRLLPPGETLTVFASRPHSLLFYLDRPTSTLPATALEDLKTRAAQPTPLYGLMSRKVFDRLPADLRSRLRILYPGPGVAPQEPYLLVSNQPTPRGPSPGRRHIGPPAAPAPPPGQPVAE